MQTWFFVLMAVGNEPGDHMHHKIDGATMARMLDLRNILELIDDGLDNGPFAHQQLIREMHEMVLHVFTQPGDKLEPLFKEQLGERGRDVAAITEQLAMQPFDQDRNRGPVINGAWSQAARQQFSPIVDRQVQFEAKEPPHRTLPTPGVNCKDAMLVDAFGVTNLQRSRNNEADPGANAKSALEVGKHWNHETWNTALRHE